MDTQQPESWWTRDRLALAFILSGAISLIAVILACFWLGYRSGHSQGYEEGKRDAQNQFRDTVFMLEHPSR